MQGPCTGRGRTLFRGAAGAGPVSAPHLVCNPLQTLGSPPHPWNTPRGSHGNADSGVPRSPTSWAPSAQ